MSNAHTPGPWTVSRGGWDDNAHACYSLEGVKDVRVADARLISAAPDLLVASKAVLEMCLFHGDFRNGVTDPTGSIDEGDVTASRLLKGLKEAIAKAEGASNG